MGSLSSPKSGKCNLHSSGCRNPQTSTARTMLKTFNGQCIVTSMEVSIPVATGGCAFSFFVWIAFYSPTPDGILDTACP